MLDSIYGNLKEVLEMTWPMLVISVILVASIRITYLIKHKEAFVLYKEICYLLFMLYILCMFQVVTAGDINMGEGNNFVPFQEILRYELGSRLFIKNVIGNVFLFLPYGIFASMYADIKKWWQALLLILLAAIAIELTQLGIGRVFDVDDILLNGVGGLIGYYLYTSLDNVANLAPKVFKSKIFLNVISTSILLIGIIVILSYLFM